MFWRQFQHRRGARALLPAGILLAALLFSPFVLIARPAAAAANHVDVTVLNSDINPGSAHFLSSAISTAERDGAQALVIEIDTPGGDTDSMKQITQAELGSNVPIITYVYPTGGRAASAGAFVALSAPLAAMAPTTRIGASSPISSSGADLDKTLLKKVENDLVAQITGVQRRFGRNTDLAAKMVTDAASYDDTTALQQHIVNLSAITPADLLNKVDGLSVTLYSGRTVTLQTAGITMQSINPGPFDGLYALLLDPNVSFLLLVVALIGIYLEISHPGMILPGVAGGIALILFLFSAGSLAPNWTGLILFGLALILLVLDVRLPTHGVLTVGAVVSLIIGALLFFNSGGPEGGPPVNPVIVYIMAGIVGLLSFTLVAAIVRAQRRRPPSGVSEMIGAKATALTPLLPEGRVSYCGENWAAALVEPYTSADAGSEVEIVAVEGLRLYVRPALNTLPASADPE